MNHSGLQQTRAQLPNPQVARTCLGQRCPNSFWERGRVYPTGAAMAPGGSGWAKVCWLCCCWADVSVVGSFLTTRCRHSATNGSRWDDTRSQSKNIPWMMILEHAAVALLKQNLSQEDWTYLKLAPAPMQAASTDSLMSLSLWGVTTCDLLIPPLSSWLHWVGSGFSQVFLRVLSAYIDGPSILLTSATWNIKDHATPTSRCCELSPELPLGLTWKSCAWTGQMILAPKSCWYPEWVYHILYYIMYIMYLLSWAVWGSKDLQLQLQASPRIL